MATWDMFAHQYANGRFHTIGARQYVELHQLGEPIIPVLVEEITQDDEISNAWGWMGFETGWHKADTEPCMIWPTWVQFSMCFPYGPEAEVEAGKGRILRLLVTKR